MDKLASLCSSAFLDISRAKQYKKCDKDCTYHANTKKEIISKRKNNPPKASTATKESDKPSAICSFVPFPLSAVPATPSELLLPAKEVPLQRISETGEENGSALDSVSESSNSESSVSPDAYDAYLFCLKEDPAVSPSDAVPSASVDFGNIFFLLNFLDRRSDAILTSVSAFLINPVKGITIAVTIKSKARVN